MPATNNMISPGADPVKITLKEIKDCKLTKSIGNGKEIELPYTFIFTEGSEIIDTQNTTKTLSTNKWSKKFYSNKEGYTNFTKDHALLAITKILERIDPEKYKSCFIDGKFDINKLEGLEFNAVVSESKDGVKFINWVGTFKVNNVDVPNPRDNSDIVQDIFDNSLGKETVSSGLPF